MKKVILLSLLTTGHFAMADEVCGGLKIFQESENKSAVAVLKTEDSQKLFVGTYKPIFTRVETVMHYNLKDSKGSTVFIAVKDTWNRSACTRMNCHDVFSKSATLTIGSEDTVFLCQK
ncbi:MAG: hypothetical protein A4S09_01415 [Proteobacteria bacterium SG_bin7]|nr:MAG: hypothetical protein A4S09_01415 [Proteobacteria bacterium SG_bin7]